MLEEKFSGSFVNVIKMADKSAEKLIQLVVDNFSSYDDTATFEGKKGFESFENFGVTASCSVHLQTRSNFGCRFVGLLRRTRIR